MVMKKWRIRRNRDWVIAAFFLLLLSYLAASVYRQPVNRRLIEFSPVKMSIFNQPEHQGVYGLTLLLATVLYTLLWVWQRKAEGKNAWKLPVFLWALTGAAMMVLLLSYQMECRRIVNTPWDTNLVPRVSVTLWSEGEPAEREPYEAELNQEAQKELLVLCLDLQESSKEEQAERRGQMDDEWEADIRISYPEYKGHAYTLWFSMKDDIVRFHRGHSAEEDVYYDGTEIRDFFRAYRSL